ncbi:unnamed protein product [Closterium sp. Naga37s-1]|nr:unnamed protein product [Closterium sp. Naga37s-1]
MSVSRAFARVARAELWPRYCLARATVAEEGEAAAVAAVAARLVREAGSADAPRNAASSLARCMSACPGVIRMCSNALRVNAEPFQWPRWAGKDAIKFWSETEEESGADRGIVGAGGGKGVNPHVSDSCALCCALPTRLFLGECFLPASPFRPSPHFWMRWKGTKGGKLGRKERRRAHLASCVSYRTLSPSHTSLPLIPLSLSYLSPSHTSLPHTSHLSYLSLSHTFSLSYLSPSHTSLPLIPLSLSYLLPLIPLSLSYLSPSHTSLPLIPLTLSYLSPSHTSLPLIPSASHTSLPLIPLSLIPLSLSYLSSSHTSHPLIPLSLSYLSPSYLSPSHTSLPLVPLSLSYLSLSLSCLSPNAWLQISQDAARLAVCSKRMPLLP